MNSPQSMLSLVRTPQPDVDGRWCGNLRLIGGKGLEAFEATAELLGYFARFASSGAFATSAAVACSVHCKTTASHGELMVQLDTLHLHPGAWRILLQMLAHTHAMEPYEELSLSVVGETMAVHSDRTPTFALGQPYPPQFESPKLLTQFQQKTSWEAGFCLSLQFARDVSSAEVIAISESVDDWGALIYTGGFTPIATEIDGPLLDKPDTYRVGRDKVEIMVSNCDCDAQAVDALLNMLVSLQGKLPLLAIESST